MRILALQTRVSPTSPAMAPIWMSARPLPRTLLLALVWLVVVCTMHFAAAQTPDRDVRAGQSEFSRAQVLRPSDGLRAVRSRAAAQTPDQDVHAGQPEFSRAQVLRPSDGSRAVRSRAAAQTPDRDVRAGQSEFSRAQVLWPSDGSRAVRSRAAAHTPDRDVRAGQSEFSRAQVLRPSDGSRAVRSRAAAHTPDRDVRAGQSEFSRAQVLWPSDGSRAVRSRATAQTPDRDVRAGQSDRSRAVRREAGAGRRSNLDEKVVVHSDSANVRSLIKFLAPRGWRTRFDVAASRVDHALVFHAETTRRRALDQLCSSLGLKGIFYPRKRMVLIVEGRRQ